MTELTGVVITEPVMVEGGDCQFRLESSHRWYLVILKDYRRLPKVGQHVKVAGVLVQDRWLLAYGCKNLGHSVTEVGVRQCR